MKQCIEPYIPAYNSRFLLLSRTIIKKAWQLARIALCCMVDTVGLALEQLPSLRLLTIQQSSPQLIVKLSLALQNQVRVFLKEPTLNRLVESSM